MKITITGDRGFIGTHLKEIYPNARGFDIQDGLDVRDTELLKAHLQGTDVVVHLAALVSVEQSKSNPREYIDNNILGTMSVIEASIATGVKRIVYASSAACYEPDSSVYAVTKYTSELLMQTYSQLIHTVSLRFFNIYGEGQNPSYAAVVTAFERGIKSGEITIYGNGRQTRDFISVEDVCSAIERAVSAELESGQVMDIGTGTQTSILKLASIMSKIMDRTPSVIFGPERKEVRHSRANTEKARKLIGFESDIDLYEGLKKLL